MLEITEPWTNWIRIPMRSRPLRDPKKGSTAPHVRELVRMRLRPILLCFGVLTGPFGLKMVGRVCNHSPLRLELSCLMKRRPRK